MAVGYDESSDTILLLGGYHNRQQLITFDGTTFTDEGTTYISGNENIRGTGQYYSQLDNTLWMIEYAGGSFITMDTATRTIDYPSIVIPTNVYRKGCLATMKHQNNPYLLVVGGQTESGESTLSVVQIYSITTTEWISVIPPMQKARRGLSCAVHNDQLYAIGGYHVSSSLDTVESLYVGDGLENIANEQWSYVQGTLNMAAYGSRAVPYGNDIFVLGGVEWDSSEGIVTGWANLINIIDTAANTVELGGSLTVAMGYLSAILVRNTLYAFGGNSNVDGMIQTYQYIVLPSVNPSVSPTSLPTSATDAPSNNPSKLPTAVPTNVPSNGPSIIPTTTPSHDPSNMPSQTPSMQSSEATPAPSIHASGAPIRSVSSQSPSRTPTRSPLREKQRIEDPETTHGFAKAGGFEPMTSDIWIIIVSIAGGVFLLLVVFVIIFYTVSWRKRNFKAAHNVIAIEKKSDCNQSQDTKRVKAKGTSKVKAKGAPNDGHIKGELQTGNDAAWNNVIFELKHDLKAVNPPLKRKNRRREGSTSSHGVGSLITGDAMHDTRNIQPDEFVVKGDDETCNTIY
eukprot:906505_1